MRGAVAILAPFTFIFVFTASAANWTLIASPGVEIFTDSGEKTGVAVLQRFEVLQRIFNQSYSAEPPERLRVFIFSSPADFLKYRPDPSAAGFYISGKDREFIVLNDEKFNLNRIAAHEYLHLVMHHASGVLPNWLEEGVPEFYSTVWATATDMRAGKSIEPSLHVLASQPWLSAEDLSLGSAADGGIFYAESWALVHMLSLSPSWRTGMPEFLKLLSQGREQQEAFAAAFGKSMDDAIVALRHYVRSMKEVKLPAPPLSETDSNAFQVTSLAPLDARLALADLALHTEHPSLARSLFLSAEKENPASPAAAAGLGELALAEHRDDEARRELERAIAMGYRDADTYFQLAMLTKDDKLLAAVLEIDPHFAEAHFLLGVRATDRGDFAGAIEHLRQAVATEPRRFTYWNALGYAQAKSGDRQGAAESARRATILAQDAQEEQMAAALTQLAADEPAVRPFPSKKRGNVTPSSWQNPKGDTRAEGVLTQVDCESDPVHLMVEVPGEPIARTIELNVLNPSAVELVNVNGVSTTLTCGGQSRPVAVEYFAASREITRIEFKGVVIMKR